MSHKKRFREASAKLEHLKKSKGQKAYERKEKSLNKALRKLKL